MFPLFVTLLLVLANLLHLSTGLCIPGPLACSGRGTCNSLGLCVCEPPHHGPLCEQSLCDSTVACNGNGLCLGNALAPTCMCYPNYGGLRCEILLDAGGKSLTANLKRPIFCTAEDCNGSGVCVGTREAESFICLCHPGFTGRRCEHRLQDLVNRDNAGSTILCTAADCSNNGFCIGTKREYVCACNLGFSGPRCQTKPYPLCDASDCNNNGLCIGTKGQQFCACNLGASGPRCEKGFEGLCDTTDCNNVGLCLGTKTLFVCICPPLYSGKRCEAALGTDLLPHTANAFCDVGDCNGNGICIGTKGNPQCLCNLGYFGLRCEIEPLCNPLLHCGGRLCLGTATKFTCL